MKEKFKVCIDTPFKNCEHVYPIQQKKVAEIIDSLKEDKNVKRIILFGSSVTSRCHRDSDIDIYIEVVKETKLINKYFDFVYDLWTNFTTDERLKKEILTKGVTVYEQ